MRERERESFYLEVGEMVEADVVEGDDDGPGDVPLPGHPQDGVRGGDLVELVVSIAIWGEERSQTSGLVCLM